MLSEPASQLDRVSSRKLYQGWKCSHYNERWKVGVVSNLNLGYCEGVFEEFGGGGGELES